MAFYSPLLEAIPAYTGLSPAAFFTILGMMIAVYQLVSSMFVDETSHQQRALGSASSAAAAAEEAPREPVQMGEVTEEELRAFDGSDPRKPLLMAIKGQIYDVSMSRMFYGPGGPYALFAGRDASRALALMSFDPKDLTGNIEGLSPDELETLQEWKLKFEEKYVKVGQIVKEKTSRVGQVSNAEEKSGEETKEEAENIGKDQ